MTASSHDPFSQGYNPFAAPETNDFAQAVDSDQPQLATRSARFAGAFLDGILMMPVSLVVFFYLFRRDPTGAVGMTALEEITFSLVAATAGMMWYLLLNGYLLASKGQTIGKLAVKTRIVDFQSGGHVSFGRVCGLRMLVMQLLYLIPMIGGFAALVGILLIFRSSRRCLHDEIAGTKVISVA